MALARGDRAGARARFEQALAVDPTAAEARLGMADTAAGDPAEVRVHLEQALRDQPTHAGAHARLAALTGRAPHVARSLPEAVQLAGLHPYDPRALLEAGRRLAQAGRGDEAVPVLEAVLGLADLDPAASAEAIALLPGLSERWQARRVVPVHVYVDEGLRQQTGWRFRQRLLWLEISGALDPLLHARFVVVSFSDLDGAPPDTRLEAWLVALRQRTAGSPDSGIFAAFTAEPTPRRSGAHLGIAAYLGRHLVVRDAPGEATGRVLAHEVLHVYGGIHVLDDLDSLMNPSGDSRRIDPLNAAIVRSLSARGFAPGGIERNVLDRVDVAAVSDAFSQALRANLAYRETGLSELLGDARQIGPGAAAEVRRVTGIDAHLGDVSRFAARVFWAAGRRVESVAVLEAAAQLYGRETPDGRAAWIRAQALRQRLKAELGVD